MSPAMDQDVAARVLESILARPAEFRSATDIVSPIGKIYELMGATTLVPQTPIAPPVFDSWMFETLFIIDSFRNVSDGWDGSTARAPSRAALHGAEMLTAYLAVSTPERRPTLCVDALGRPAFATNIPNFYVHLTVDEAGRLTWYAVSEGVEYFDDDVAFDGHRLPESLGSLFQIST
jgi:hypothetical protein